MIWDEFYDNVGNGLNKVLVVLEELNVVLFGVLGYIDFNWKVGKIMLLDIKLWELIFYFNKYCLLNEDFVFFDLFGVVYEYLIVEFVDLVGKKGGEFYMFCDVVQLMVCLVKLVVGMLIYDFCVGLGGMFIQVKQYIEECGGDFWNLLFCGQDNNGGVWVICKINMLLYGIKDVWIENEDML